MVAWYITLADLHLPLTGQFSLFLQLQGGGGSMLDIIIIGVDNLVHVISSVDNFDQLPVEVFRY